MPICAIGRNDGLVPYSMHAKLLRQVYYRFVERRLGGPQENASNFQMTGPDDKTPWLLQGFGDALVDRDSPHFREFQEVSENFVRGYKRFVELGFPSETIGLAMLGATINMYTMLEIREQLPDLLRKVAQRIETEERLH